MKKKNHASTVMISAVLYDIQAAGAVTGSKTNIAGNLYIGRFQLILLYKC